MAFQNSSQVSIREGSIREGSIRESDEEGSHPLPKRCVRAKTLLRSLKEPTAQFLNLIDKKSEDHKKSKHRCQMLFAMPIIVFKVITLVLWRIECLIFHLPARPTSSHHPLLIDELIRLRLPCQPLRFDHRKERFMIASLDDLDAPFISAFLDHLEQRAVSAHAANYFLRYSIRTSVRGSSTRQIAYII